MKILFVSSGDELCRALIARHILHQLDEKLEIFVAATEPVIEIPSSQFVAMKALGFDIDSEHCSNLTELSGVSFDFLITISHGLHSLLKKNPLHFSHKLHMEFQEISSTQELQKDEFDCLTRLSDEMRDELAYFYHHYVEENKNTFV